MTGYTNILIAIDLSEESETVLARAAAVAGTSSNLHLVYVQEPMESVYLGAVPYGPVFVGMDQVKDKLETELRGKLAAWAERFSITDDNTHFQSGAPSTEIHALALSLGADLIVLGTHGQRGVQVLLGSTANSVLHGASCDVLAVRIRENGDG